MSSLKISKSGRIVTDSQKTSEDRLWRNMSELEQTPEFEEFVAREYPEQEGQLANPVSRRRFVQLMGASFALAGVTQGCRWEEEKILPLSRRPDGYIPGVAKHYATSFELGGVAAGLVVTCMEGRPIKIEGNDEHPYTGGGSTSLAQASILEMYDPDRSKSIVRQDKGKAIAATKSDLLKALRALKGKTVHVLSEATSSPTMVALRRQLKNVKWHEYEALSQDNSVQGNKMAFGRPMRTHYHLDKARVIATFDAELFGANPAALRHSMDIAKTRDPDSGSMSRIYSMESNFSTTGGFADHRLPVRSELIKPILLGLEMLIGNRQLSDVAADVLREAKVADFIGALAGDLKKNKGSGLIVVGNEQPPEVHAIAARINATLGGMGKTVTYTPELGNNPSHMASLVALLKDMNTGKVENLIILGGNPIYDTPVDAEFTQALAKVGTSYHLSLTHNETSKLVNWHVNRAHYLESWGDTRTYDGTVSIIQPMIEPLYDGMSAIEMMKILGGDQFEDISVEAAILRVHGFRAVSDKGWRRILHAGFKAGTAFRPDNVQVQAFTETPLTATQKLGSTVEKNLELTFRASATYDGRYANNGWLIETPDFITKLTWDNAALVGPATARNLGISNGDVIEISVAGNSLKIAAHITPGQAPGSIGLPLGWGRKRAGYVGGHEDLGIDSIGFDTYALRTINGFYSVSGATVTKTGSTYPLAETQDHFEMDDLGTEAIQRRADVLIKNSTLATYKKDGEKIITKDAHLPIEKSLLKPIASRNMNASLHDKHDYGTNHQWGMTIDLGKCVGCNACMLACQAENNVPIVGKEEVMNNREMHWIRIDRYFKGNPDNPQLVYQPVHCQQCENAPCELVCPVEATSHSAEGLNDMTYNRCVGTRYCANNCPYKVRRFNYRYWNKDFELARNKVRSLLSNPDVTVRSRGVMEKCTWCVQRIERTKITAKNNRRPIVDGEIKTACQQACAPGAITFGDLTDKESDVYKKQDLPRSYALLASLNNLPRNAYLARITNPNPALSNEKAKG